ncbi:hypothetical protein B0T10DRAFT_534170 [Thelonectria olida]|uniref:Uncharacterized protein n=1 Tax=Thelonectria olida TaxID=1576542 RepID=A0A9P8VP97_9HYPO|nr:hypothetical protein B0T10DRAFT_534170 [Thelonectria olida]
MHIDVYTGTWVDYSHGRIVGATITLTARNGSVLVAALSIFLLLVGSQFWTILSFVIHQINATDRATDILHCQHQVIFRNAGTSVGAARELFALPFPWQHGQRGSRDLSLTILRSWAWAFLALTNFCMWSAAGLFSSAITKPADGNILIASGTCGIVYDNTSDSGLSSKLLNTTIIADAHARACYKSNSNPAQLPTHPVVSGETSAQLCLSLTADTSTLTTTLALTHRRRTEFLIAGSISYYGGHNETSSWLPTEEFYLPDADLSLISLLPNFMFSMTPIDDPFFGFHPINGSEFCQPDNLINIMVCTDQYQLCNPKRQTPICTPLTAGFQLKDYISHIQLNPTQNATASLIVALNGAAGITSSLGGRGAGALLASNKVTRHIQGFLPSNQWATEIENWFAISLTKLQYALAEYPTGPTSPLTENLALKAPRTPEGQRLCRSMKVPNPGEYKSFGVLALVLVFIVGGMVIITSVTLEPITKYIYNNWVSKHQFRMLQWTLDGKLQLQRMAYEHSGVGRLEYQEVGKPRATSCGDSRHAGHPGKHATSRVACMDKENTPPAWGSDNGAR